MAKVPRETADDVRGRDTEECQRCAEQGKHTLHHIRRTSRGGTDDEFNLILLCRACHDIVERLYDSGKLSHENFFQWLEKEWKNVRRDM